MTHWDALTLEYTQSYGVYTCCVYIYVTTNEILLCIILCASIFHSEQKCLILISCFIQLKKEKEYTKNTS